MIKRRKYVICVHLLYRRVYLFWMAKKKFAKLTISLIWLMNCIHSKMSMAYIL